jgi:hypothetical protein
LALAAWQRLRDALRLVAREQFAAESATQGLDELTRLSGLGRAGERKIQSREVIWNGESHGR